MKVDLQNLNKFCYDGLAKLNKDSNPCTLCKETPNEVHFHGSDVGKCPRSLFYKWTLDHKEEITPLTHTQFIDGHLSERMIVEGLKSYFSDNPNYNIVINDNESNELSMRLLGYADFIVEIVGHYDILMFDSEAKEKIVVECKAVRSYSFKNNFLAGKVPQNYLYQVAFYKELYNCDRAVIIAKNRETSEICTPIEINVKPSELQKRFDMLINVKRAVKENSIELAYKEHTSKNDFECKYCPYNKQCWS